MRARTRSYLAALLGGGLVLVTGSSQALNFQFDELDISLETSVTAGLAVRGEDASKELIGKSNLADQVQVADGSAPGAFSTNGDDGNLNYPDAGDLFFAQIKLSSDLTIQWNDWGIFARGNYRYDPKAMNDEFFDDFDYGPNRSLSYADKRAREETAEDAIGNDPELFDLYLFGNMEILDRSVSVRLGRQVLNWGESTFIANGINSIIPIDARQARGPGAEVKEVFRPFGMAWVSAELVRNLSMEMFYQFEWEETIPDPSGTYFSTSDFVGAGSTAVQTGFGRCNENLPAGACTHSPGGTNVPEVAPNEPDDGGQYGARLTYFAEWLNATEFSLYGANYHSRTPLFSGTNAFTPLTSADGGGFFRDYPEDIKMYGLSFNTYLEFLDAAFQGEYSFHKDQPLQIDDVELLLHSFGIEYALGQRTGQNVNATNIDNYRGITYQPGTTGVVTRGYERFDYHQWNFSLLKFLGPNWTGANQTSILVEVAGQHVDDMPEPSELPFEVQATYVPNQAAAATAFDLPSQDRDGYADDFSWGYRMAFALRYQNVLNRFNLTPNLRFYHDVEGNSPTPISNFLEERKQLSLGVDGSYLDNWEAGVSYTFFFGSQDTSPKPTDPSRGGQRVGGYTNNTVEDRDFLNMYVRYTF